MLTPPTRATVSALSLLAALGGALALGACAAGPSRAAYDATSITPSAVGTIRFDNEGEVYVDVYLVSEQRQWRLARVASGAVEMLRIPDAALVATSGLVRLAVIAGGPPSVQVARDPRASFTVAQPAAELLGQRFSFVQRQMGSPQLLELRADVGRP